MAACKQSAGEMVALAPFFDWVDRRVAQYTAAGEDNPVARVVADLGWTADAGARRLHRWRHEGWTERPRDEIEDALNSTGVYIWELYDDEDAARDTGDKSSALTVVTAFCPSCRTAVVPMDDGRCVWCDSQTSGAEEQNCAPVSRLTVTRSARREREELMSELGITKRGTCHFAPGQLDASVCVCGAKKTKQAMLCRACRKKYGYHSPSTRIVVTGRGSPKHITEEQIQQARRRYVAGESFNAIAKSMIAQTGYSSWQVLSNALCRIFKARGWPARDRIQATVAASYKHGLKRRSTQKGYYHYRRELAGDLRPRCEGIKTQHPNKGTRCTRSAMAGSRYCVVHDPERKAEMAAMIRAARTGEAEAMTVPLEPLSAWLISLYNQLGAWKRVGAVVGLDHMGAYGYAHPLARYGKTDGPRARVMRSSVERMLANARAAGYDFTFEQLYELEHRKAA